MLNPRPLADYEHKPKASVMQAPPVVAIVWEDAKVLDGGAWADNAKHDYVPHFVHQVGFLLLHTEQGIIISQAWHPDLVAARDQIPLAMIRSMTVLEPAKPPRKR
jgi:hypothetical protein